MLTFAFVSLMFGLFCFAMYIFLKIAIFILPFKTNSDNDTGIRSDNLALTWVDIDDSPYPVLVNRRNEYFRYDPNTKSGSKEEAKQYSEMEHFLSST